MLITPVCVIYIYVFYTKLYCFAFSCVLLLRAFSAFWPRANADVFPAVTCFRKYICVHRWSESENVDQAGCGGAPPSIFCLVDFLLFLQFALDQNVEEALRTGTFATQATFYAEEFGVKITYLRGL